jgi:asparagine synthase (glutamine-hydrolysing)
MCGIAGIYHYAEPDRAVDRATLTRMTRALAHRGPDGEGLLVDGSLGLGHRRLAIVDLSPTGAQPMGTPDRTRWIVYNGEFYNHESFRAALEAEGVTFRGHSDTETLLHLLATRGPDALAEIAGIFGLAYWERDTRRLTLARDPLGVKQVYFHDDGRSIYFASEIKALYECPEVPRKIDPEAVNEYLHFHTPLFDRTFLAHVRQLRAGELLRVTPAGHSRRRYWEIVDFTPRGGTPDDNVRALERSLQHVVREQLMSDVPVGAFFSGGIDSTAVAAMAARTGLRPRCFGVHFTGQGVIDERPFQEAAAKALGLELELITLDGSTFPDDVVRTMFFQDQPVIGAAMLPMDAVAGLAARRVKVCVGGQAADEVFGGYARYALAHPWKVASQWLTAAPAALAQRLRVRAGASPSSSDRAQPGGNVWKQFAEFGTLRRIARNLTTGARAIHDWRERYFHNFAKVPEATWRTVITAPELVSRERARAVFRDTLARSPATDPADALMHWDAQTYLTGLFQQDDRMSMAHSLESRVPLADPRVVRFAFRSGFDLKFRDGASKWILRRAVADILPGEVLNRRKVGFDTPALQWMQGRHRAWVRDTLTGRTARARGFWNVTALSRWLDDPRDPLWFDVVWKALCIEVWSTLCLDGAWRDRTSGIASPPPTGSVFIALR